MSAYSEMYIYEANFEIKCEIILSKFVTPYYP